MAKDVVIFLHGRGQGPESVSVLEDALEGAKVLAPSGGVALRRGRTWFQNREIGFAEPESVLDAERHFLEWLEQQEIAGRMPWLCGFSNGGAFAGHLLLQHPQRFAGAALLSAPLVLPPWPDSRLAEKNVLYGHGDKTDTVVSQTLYEAAESYLSQRSGCSLTIRRYSAGHVISDEMAGDLGVWFRGVQKRPLEEL